MFTRVEIQIQLFFIYFSQLNVQLSFTQFPVASPWQWLSVYVHLFYTHNCMRMYGHAFLLIFLFSFTFSLIIELSIVSLHLYKQFKGNALSILKIPRRLYYKRRINANSQLVINILLDNSAKKIYITVSIKYTHYTELDCVKITE